MKRKYIAWMLGMALAVTPVGAYAEDTAEAATEQAAGDSTAQEGAQDMPQGGAMEMNENQVMGEVTEVGEDSITVKQNDSEETTTISVTSETAITKGGMGGGMGQGGQQPGSDSGEVPEKPDGEDTGEGGGNGEAPEKPDGEGTGENGEVPEKPDGDGMGVGGGENGEVPEKPDGETSDSTGGDGGAPELPDGDGGGMGGQMESETIALSDIAVGDNVMITLNDDGSAASITVMSDDMGGGMDGGGMGGQQSGGVDSYTAANTCSEDTTLEGQTIDSTGTDENAVLVDSDVTVEITDSTVTRTSSDSTGGDNSSFYGVGAAILATAGTTTVSDSTITTDAAGGAGVFAYGDAIVNVINSVITTQQDTSGGIHAAGGGTLHAWDLTVETNGRSAAAIRSDRGGGTMVVDGGSYVSNGADSPAVYCTADISINEAELTANGSEGVCIEGLNTLRLFDCNLTSNMSDDERNDNTWSVIVYQSMSGDSEVGNGTFEMVGGSLTSGNGGVFYTTNTECTITLSGVEIAAAEDSEFFLQCTGNNNSRGWGQSGSNGSDCLFTGIAQSMTGDVVWDSISMLDFYMTEGSTLTGAIVDDETYAGEGGSGYCNVVIDSSSSWIVTGDSTVSSLQNAGSITDAEGNAVSIVGTDGTVYVEGTSAYTVTVGSYSTEADTTGASAADSWDSYAVEM